MGEALPFGDFSQQRRGFQQDKGISKTGLRKENQLRKKECFSYVFFVL